MAQRESLGQDESKVGIRLNKNVLFDVNFVDAITGNTHGVDYDSMVVYIDWLVKQQNNYNPDNGGVIPADLLGEWNLGVWNRFTNEYQSEEEFNYFIYIRALEDQLKGVDDVIASLNFLYANPDSDEALADFERAVGSLKIAVLSVASGAAGFVATGLAAAAIGLGGGTFTASTLGFLVSALGAIPVVGWVAAALVIAFVAFFGGKSSDNKAAEQKREAIKKYCLEELNKFKRLRETAVSELEYAKKLDPGARKPINLDNKDKRNPTKQTAFEYDDERFQTKNERRVYSANMKTPIIFSVLPGRSGDIVQRKPEVEPDTTVVEWASITNNQ
jgi:hypothetical protein